jgi:hypothetical protein
LTFVFACSADVSDAASPSLPDDYSAADRLALPGTPLAMTAVCAPTANPASFTPESVAKQLVTRVAERMTATTGELPGRYTRELQLDRTFATCESYETREPVPGERTGGAAVPARIHLRGVIFVKSEETKIDVRMPVAIDCTSMRGCTFGSAETRINRGLWRGQVHGPDEAAKFTLTRGNVLEWNNGAGDPQAQLLAKLSAE